MELSSPRKRKPSTPYQPSPPPTLVEIRSGVTEVQLSAARVATPSPLLRPPGAAPGYLSGKHRLGRRVFIGRIVLDLLDRSVKRSLLRRTAAGACTYYFYSSIPGEKPGVEHTHEAHQVLQPRPCWDGDSFVGGVHQLHQRFVSGGPNAINRTINGSNAKL
jgi:hypothetical protein